MLRRRNNWLDYLVLALLCIVVGIFFECADRKLDVEPEAVVKTERNVQKVRIVELPIGKTEPYRFQDDHPQVGIRRGDPGVIVHVQVDNETFWNPLPTPTHLSVSLRGEHAGLRIVEVVCDVDDEAKAFMLDGNNCCAHADVLMPKTEPNGSYDVLLYVHKGVDAAPVDGWWVRCVGYVGAE